MIKINLTLQKLFLMDNDDIIREYTISSGKNGIGEVRDTGMTPRGMHIVRAKIGGECPVNTVFRSRRPTGEIYQAGWREQFPDKDWILTRIMWLSGLEVGKNRLGNVDTMQRYIYIHGTPDEVEMGTPGSKGCIRMRNENIVELYNLVPVGTRVLLEE